MKNSLKKSGIRLVIAFATVASASCEKVLGQSLQNPYPISATVETNAENPALSDRKDEVRDNGFFSYKVTGNPDVDVKLYHEAKVVFVKHHPDRYQDMVNESRPTGRIKMKKSDFDALPSFKQSAILSQTDLYEIED